MGSRCFDGGWGTGSNVARHFVSFQGNTDECKDPYLKSKGLVLSLGLLCHLQRRPLKVITADAPKAELCYSLVM